jgi:hypothetical protein
MTLSLRRTRQSAPERYPAQPSCLYVVPDRRVRRASGIPGGRTLHLIDIENLMGGPRNSPVILQLASELYKESVPTRFDDHFVLAANRGLAVQAGLSWPSAQLLVGNGKDGADLALIQRISDIEWISARYDRVILGSGDGIFASHLSALRALGIAIGIVAPIGTISRRLVGTAHFVRLIPNLSYARVIA